MDPKLQDIISWVRSGASHAQDPRLALVNALYKSSSIDPHTIKAKYLAPGQLVVKANLLYTSPDLAQLKKKKLVMKRGSKDVTTTLGGTSIKDTVSLPFSRPMLSLTLEEVLLLCNLYVIFTDERKLKLFLKLIQGE